MASKAEGDTFLRAEERGDEMRHPKTVEERVLERTRSRISLPSCWGTGGRKL